jgi:hypothetical protein
MTVSWEKIIAGDFGKPEKTKTTIIKKAGQYLLFTMSLKKKVTILVLISHK